MGSNIIYIVEMVNNWIEDERSLAGWSMVSPDSCVENDVTLVEIFKSLFIQHDENHGTVRSIQRCSTFTDVSKYDESEQNNEREYSFSYMCAPSKKVQVFEEESRDPVNSETNCCEMMKLSVNQETTKK